MLLPPNLRHLILVSVYSLSQNAASICTKQIHVNHTAFPNKVKKMAMSAAERQRKRREKLKSQEPDKYEEKKRKHAEYMKNKRKVIGQLSATEQNKRGKQWREANTKRKNKKGQEMENEAHKAPLKSGFERRYL